MQQKNPNSEISFFKLALELEKQFKKELIDNGVHFRANLNSLSLISVGAEKPELGVQCKKHDNWSTEILFDYIERINNKPLPQRPTPEKSLQAWVIKQAQENDNILTFADSIRFITSELAFSDPEKGKIVSDIIGFDTKQNRIVILELKSDRLLKRLVEQVDNFDYIISQNQQLFDDLLSIYGYKTDNKPLKAILWPNAKTSPLAKLEDLKIAEYVYDFDGNNYKIKNTHPNNK